jgi:hypothetical protein
VGFVDQPDVVFSPKLSGNIQAARLDGTKADVLPSFGRSFPYPVPLTHRYDSNRYLYRLIAYLFNSAAPALSGYEPPFYFVSATFAPCIQRRIRENAKLRGTYETIQFACDKASGIKL